LKTGIGLAAVGLSCGTTTTPRPGERDVSMPNHAPPNLLFVFADQLRASSVGYAGEEQVRTPHLDAFAGEGVVFTNAISNHPVCTPYRASLLTGRYPLSTGIFMNDLLLPVTETSIAEVLKGRGYDTGYIGKWHLDGLDRRAFTPPGPRRQGFDHWEALNCSHKYMDTFYYKDTPERIPVGGYEPDVQTDLAIRFLEGRAAADKPFCLFVSYGTPHEPYRLMPQEYLDEYPPEDIRFRPNCPDWNREDIAGYYAHTTALDRNFGRLMETLEKGGLSDNTIVVFTSDHGDMHGSHGQRRKQRPWEECINIPFVIRGPAQSPAGSRTDALIGAPDVMPTLLAMMGCPVSETVEGRDLSHAVMGKSGEEHDSVLIMAPAPFSEAFKAGIPEWRGVRTKRYTYVETLEGPWLLYDNVEDPYQMKNLAGDPGQAALKNELQGHLRDWLAKTGDGFLPREELIEQWGYDVDKHGATPYII
jgi:arylsulfatase A-like enzyme